ncbi:MAG: RagB/SusD family nutrient uptake outer membrane protein, partial [Cyclobacteriaceae bacterium]
MKKLYIILLSALVLTSCGDEFLDLQPESVADIKDIYKTETDFIQAMIGAYDELQSSGQYGRNFHYLFDTRADLVGESTAGFQDGIYYEIDRFLLRSENPLIQQTWASLYTGINRANLIIEKLDESSVLASTKRNLNAEARFIRALSYFNIVRIWGAAPLITKTISPDEALEVTRNSKLDIYNFIIAELDQISTTLP